MMRKPNHARLTSDAAVLLSSAIAPLVRHVSDHAVEVNGVPP
jgi:hypothetical protein